MFDEVARRIETAIPDINIRDSPKPGRPPTPFRTKLQWLLLRLANPVRYHTIATNYGVLPGAVQRGVEEAMIAINECLGADELRSARRRYSDQFSCTEL